MENHSNKVYIRSLDGAYLSGAGTQWELTGDRSKAAVFDYVQDRVQEQLAGLKKSQGIVLVTVTVDPKEIHESCDDCEQLVAPHRAFFDGKRFLCADCRE